MTRRGVLRRARRSAHRSGAWSSDEATALGSRSAPGRRPGRRAPHRPRRTPAGRGRRRAPAARPGRTASTSRVIIVNETIEDSSTTTTSCGQPVAAVVPEAGAVVAPGRQPSSRCRVTAGRSPSRVLVDLVERLGGVRDRLLQPRGRLAGRRARARRAAVRSPASPAARPARSPATVVVLPVPGPPVSTWPTAARRLGTPRAARRTLASRKTRSKRRLEQLAHRPAAARAADACRASGELPLLPPVAVEVEQPAQLQPHHALGPTATTALADTPVGPRVRVGPARARAPRRRRSSRSTPTPSRPAHGPGGQGGPRAPASSTRSSLSPPSRPILVGDVHVGGGEHAGGVEVVRAGPWLRAPGARQRRR